MTQIRPAAEDRRFVGGLATDEQLAAEKIALRMVADPRVKALRPTLQAIVREVPVASLPSGAAQIDHSIDLWTMSLAIREVCGDTANPKICWRTEDAPHSWFGYTFPGMGVSGDDPNRIYRGVFLDGESTYELSGRFPVRRSVQFSLEAARGTPGGVVQTGQSAATPDMGNQIAFIEDVNMKIGPTGDFVVRIGPEKGDWEGNFLKLTPGTVNLIVRDTLSDWAEEPTEVTIRRIAGADAPPPTYQQLVDTFVEDLPEYIRFWANFNTKWLGGIKDDQIVGPAPRDGGWGYLAGGRFNLADDEAMVITTTDKGVKAIGFQVTNPWLVMSGDARNALLSFNKGQIARNPDGSITYVVSRRDPGVANWVDTGGLAQGVMVLRWEAVMPEADPKAMLTSYRKVNFADLQGALPPGVPTVTAEQRAAQIAARADLYDVRLGKRVH